MSFNINVQEMLEYIFTDRETITKKEFKLKAMDFIVKVMIESLTAVQVMIPFTAA